MKTAVVILNWNTRQYLQQFLPGLVESVRGMDAEVVVADNASEDGSLDLVRELFPDVRRISLDRNYGFTGGYNRALAQVEAEYFVLINSDIEVSKGWLGPLEQWMDSHPECGACGPKLLSYYQRDRFEYAGAAGGLMDRWGHTYCRGRIMGRTAQDKGQYDSPASVMWVTGACLMVRSSLWKKLGGLDDRFFAHMEEIDFCWRLQLQGFKVQVVPQSVVYHLGGGTLPQNSPWKLKLNYRNNLLMLDNNLALCKGKARAAAVIRWRLFLDRCSQFVYRIKGQKDYVKAVDEAHQEFWQLRKPADGRSGRCRIDGLSGRIMFVEYLKKNI